MSRLWLVALAAVASLLLWVMATWPLPPETEPDLDPGEPDPAPSVDAPPPTAAEDPSPPSAADPASPEASPGPVEAPSAPAAAAEPESPAAQAEQLFTRENGPLAEYKAQFDREPRDSAAVEAEQQLRAAFEPKDAPTPVFRSVLCRETICKIETRFTSDTLGAYVAAMTRIVHAKFDPKLATERTAVSEAGEISVTVYAKRPPPAQ